MTHFRPRFTMRPAAILVASAVVLLSACGGGGTSTTSTSGTGTTGTTTTGNGVNSSVVSTSTTAPSVNTSTGFVGSCPSLSGGSSTPAGYEIGFCKTYYSSGSNLIAEGTYQGQAVTASEAPAARQYILNLPNTTANPWGGSLALAALAPNVTELATTGIGNLSGYALDLLVTATAPANNETSIVDFSNTLATVAGATNTTRYVTFGLWGRSKLVNEDIYGAFFGAAFGQSATPSSYLNGVTNTVAMTGNAVSHYIYSSNAAVPAGVVAAPSISGTARMSVNYGASTVSGTIDTFVQRVSGANVALTTLSAVTFSGTLVKATGAFSGTITSGGTGLIKGSLFGPAGQQAAGQFAVAGAGNRLFSGSFGVTQ
jgi:hypothetical protein